MAAASLTLRPAPARTYKKIGLLLLVGTVTCVAMLVVESSLEPWLRVAIAAPIFLIVALGLALHGLRSAVTLTGMGVTLTTWLGQRRDLRAADIAEAATFLHDIPRAPLTERLALRRHDGETGAILTEGAWSSEDFRRIQHHLASLGVPITPDAGRMTTAQAADRFPGVLPWWERNAIALGILIGLGAVAVVLLLALLWR